MSGSELIAEERERQVSQEGWTPAHDDTHIDGELKSAAECYLFYGHMVKPPDIWPWDASWWKNSSHIRNLVRAGALIAAEIDRLQRLECKPK